jgi:hypothetical protein
MREKERRQQVRTITEHVLTETGILKGLKDIQKEELRGTARKHALIIDFDNGRVELVWGNKFSVKGKIVGEQKPLFGDGVKDYQSIYVHVDPATMDLTIQGHWSILLSKQQWQGNPDSVIDALTHAYLAPQRQVSDSLVISN